MRKKNNVKRKRKKGRILSSAPGPGTHLRTIAASMNEDHHRETLLQVARDYDDLAEIRERLVRDDPPERPNLKTGLCCTLNGLALLVPQDAIRASITHGIHLDQARLAEMLYQILDIDLRTMIRATA